MPSGRRPRTRVVLRKMPPDTTQEAVVAAVVAAGYPVTGVLLEKRESLPSSDGHPAGPVICVCKSCLLTHCAFRWFGNLPGRVNSRGVATISREGRRRCDRGYREGG